MARALDSKIRRCKSGLHALVGKNALYRPDGNLCCRACRNARQRLTANRYERIHCAGVGCAGSTYRLPNSDATYLCPRHRKCPLAWLTTVGLRVESTRLVHNLVK